MDRKKNISLKQQLIILSCILIPIAACDTTRRITWNGSEPVSCFDGNCVAVGGYNQSITYPNTTGLAFTSLSVDQGRTFGQGSQTLLLDTLSATTSGLTSVSCSGIACIAMGTYNAGTSGMGGLPLIANSTDGGHTFAQTSQPIFPLDFDNTKIAGLSGVTCNGLNCVGVGTYNFDPGAPGGGGLPLVVLSSDGGKTFAASPTPVLPDPISLNTNAALAGVSCIENNCVAVGAYNVSYTNASAAFPLAIFSNDGGKTFTSSRPTLPEDADPTKWARLHAVTCNNENRCIGVGLYNLIGAANALPLIVLSDNGGETFTKAFSPSLPASPAVVTGTSAELNGISCVQKHCVAVGFYNHNILTGPGDENPGIPLVYVSDDSGDTFTATAQPVLPSTINSDQTTTLNGVDCSGNNCVAVGGFNMDFAYVNPNGGSALSIFSDNGGQNFTSFSIPELPTGADTTKGSSFGSSAYL